MRQGTYLNVILTVNAVLLSGLVWTQVAGEPVMAGQAQAQSSGGGMINAGEQRQRMLEELKSLRQSVETTNRLIERGNLRVHVTNIPAEQDDSNGDGGK